MEYMELSTRFASISPERREELESSILLWVDESDTDTEQEQWDLYFEQESKGMSPEQADALWQDLNVSPEESLAHSNYTLEDIRIQVKADLDRTPKSELERDYLDWRLVFLIERKRMALAEKLQIQQATIRRTQELLHEASDQQEAIRGVIMTSVRKILIQAAIATGHSSIIEKLEPDELLLFLYLIGGRFHNGKEVVYSLRDIARYFHFGSHMAVTRAKDQLLSKHPGMERLISSFRVDTLKGERSDRRGKIIVRELKNIEEPGYTHTDLVNPLKLDPNF